MTMVSLREWETVRVQHSLRPAESRIAEALTRTGRMEVMELARGLEIHATSFVGRIALGALSITVRPKISGTPLLSLFRYAYGLRHLNLYGGVDFPSSHWSFQDLLIQQLAAEVAELLGRGIHREYERVRVALASPRGRIDFAHYVRTLRGAETTLPCVHHPRSEDNLLNRLLLAGLDLGMRLATDRELKGSVRRLAKRLGETVSVQPLTASVMANGWHALDRRTAAYKPALKVIEFLLNGQGVALDDEANSIHLNGFLFDMNRFFQSLMSRFLREHLDGVDVHDEFRLKGIFSYEPTHNPLGRRDPVLRPDIVLLRGSSVAAVLDAKYRDLWERPLPREMLYQLALYALGNASDGRLSTMIYPSLDPKAREQRISVQQPVSGRRQACVALRPINLLELERKLRLGHLALSGRIALARALAFGHQPPPTSVSLAA